jgi:hypothetical protein
MTDRRKQLNRESVRIRSETLQLHSLSATTAFRPAEPGEDSTQAVQRKEEEERKKKKKRFKPISA